MSKENKTVELKDEELEKVSGGCMESCPKGRTICLNECFELDCGYLVPDPNDKYQEFFECALGLGCCSKG